MTDIRVDAHRSIRKKPGSRKSSISHKQRGKKRASLLVRMGRFFLYWCLVIAIWTSIIALGVIGFYAAKLPQSSSWAIPERAPNVRIVSMDGKLIANRGANGGANMRLAHMSAFIPQAVIAIEDRRFRSHFGIDLIGLVRAMLINLLSGEIVQGGSTLTQQLAKNLFLKPQRTLERKVQEFVLALWLEANYSKNAILEMYLNRVYFGSGAYGVDAAAQRYFSKSARILNLAEAALLAGILKAPSRLSPMNNPDLAQERAQLVLTAMGQAGFIGDSDVITAMSLPTPKAKRLWEGSKHYVADRIMRDLTGLIGEIGEDIIVETTIDQYLQKEAEETIFSTLKKDGPSNHVAQGALVSLDGTGAIRALIGGKQYIKSPFNRATEAKRQPGSAFKPFVYLAALERDYTPDTIRLDKPIKIGNWSPKNYDLKYRGAVSLKQAFANSINTIAVQLAREIGPKRIIQTARKMGIRSQLKQNLSIALGTSEVDLLELTSAYAPFANGGYRVNAHMIRRIKTMDGTPLYQRPMIKLQQVIGEHKLKMMNAMLAEVIRSGTGKRAQIKHWSIAGKTGTSQNFRDGWFIGYTENFVTGIWFGNDDGSPTRKITGGSLPAEAWGQYMRSAHAASPAHFSDAPPIHAIPQPRPSDAQTKQSIQGQSIQGQPIQGQSIQGQPIQGQPIQGQPIQGQPLLKILSGQ